MAQKIYRSSLGPRSDIGTDYALIATAALLALVYLILI
jgi:hypothetical protein